MSAQATVFTNIIAAADLAALLPNCALLDARAKLGDREWGKQAFLAGHIPGARHIDLDADLAAPPGLEGRHPLPDKARWLACLERLGVTPATQVVVYDDAGGPYAARAWWMLRWVGHAAVAVLDGGLQQWRGRLESGAAQPATPSTYPPGEPLTRSISSSELLQAIGAPRMPALIDARSRARWAGAEEPIDPVAGHIPGAQCYPFQDNLDERGCFKSAADLRTRWQGIDAAPICYCGSGVTAAHNILAMHIAGLPEATLYAESWSGWITDPARPIATAD